jgi:multicomponent Na+:H+ antiporter subunit E
LRLIVASARHRPAFARFGEAVWYWQKLSANQARSEALMRFVWTTIILVAMWCVLSGKFDAMHLGVGVLTAAAVAAGVHLRSPRAMPLLKLVAYLPWLLMQVVKSNVHVARLVLLRFEDVKPRFVRIEPGLRGDRPVTLLGCSITLTPGTVTVDTDGRWLLVHALDASSASDLEEGAMARRVARVFDGYEESD